MNMDMIKGNWKQLTGSAKAKWGELTDDDLQEAEGDREILAGKIQERYGIAKDEAESQIDEFVAEQKAKF
ncbi:MAG: CsbD family protein [Pseudomonadota bacterium]